MCIFRAQGCNFSSRAIRALKLALVALCAAASLLITQQWRAPGAGNVAAQTLPAILFVTQPPFGEDFATVNAVFGNHDPDTGATPRGGDLYLRYGDGTLRNLTAEAGYGLQAGADIAVREPSVHWSGTKALFAMVIGGTTKNDLAPVYWQIYEVSGLGRGEPVDIRRLPQPANHNNVAPLYGTDDRIIFTTDRPRNADRFTYPQLDEYESTATNTGLWSMNADGSDVRLLDHAPSGDFTPIIASDGRLVFTRWDHLQRDQQNNDRGNNGAFNFAGESSNEKLNSFAEIFPEPRLSPDRAQFHGHRINQFFPWQINEDGTDLETLNHIGRHELLRYFDSSRNGLPEFNAPEGRRNAERFLQIKEDPSRPGYFIGTNAPEFSTHAAGQIIGLLAPESANADQLQLDYITDPVTRNYTETGQTPPANHPGLFRNPLPLSNGTLLAVRTTSTYADRTTGGPLSSRYDFHLTRLERQASGYWTSVARVLANPITKAISYWDNQTYQQLTYNGALWELDPVEVRAHPRPNKRQTQLPPIEQQILTEELGAAGVAQLRTFLEARNLALIVSRDVTRRADRQQDVSLKIFGGVAQTVDPNITPVEVAFMQFFQGDLVRGYNDLGGGGRRSIAQPMRDGLNPQLSNAPAGSVRLASDGSLAAFVPARRALSWQMTKANGEPSVRERYWLTFAPGEMRACTNCHGLNSTDVVLRQPAPTNPPQALRELARWYKTTYPTPINRLTTVSAASYDPALLATEAIAVAFGANLATTTAAAGASLPTTLAGTTVRVQDSAGVERLAPLFFVSPTQVNYQIPPGTASGQALVTITNANGAQSIGALQIAAVAPGLFSADASGDGLAAALILRIKAGSAQSYEPIGVYDNAQGRFVARPIDLGPATDQVFLLLFGTGLRLRGALAQVKVKVGESSSVDAPVSFAGAQGGFVGLDQINARLPRSLIGRGEVALTMTVEGKLANTVTINIK